MTLENMIIEWGNTRPAWQRKIMRALADGSSFSEEDCNNFIEEIFSGNDNQDVKFGPEHLPHAETQAPPVQIISIAKTEYVNALESTEPLGFEPNGLTVVYGDNGSGKSGYARLLKQITGARHGEDILSDVFRNTEVNTPAANIFVHIGNQEQELRWPDYASPKLQRMLFYDAACGKSYISTESEFPYRPAALLVMDRLIDACAKIRNRIDAKLTSMQRATPLPPVADNVANTEAGKFLKGLSASASAEDVDSLIASANLSPENIAELQREETRLRNMNSGDEQQKLRRLVQKIDRLSSHLEKLQSVVGDDALTNLQEEHNTLCGLQKNVTALEQHFASEPLPGVGTPLWKALWEAARRFSEKHAYPEKAFPATKEDNRCVLCFQALDKESSHRFSEFEQFVKRDLQTQHDQAQKVFNEKISGVKSLTVRPETITDNLSDIESTHKALVDNVQELLAEYEKIREHTIDTYDGKETSPRPRISSASLKSIRKQITETKQGIQKIDRELDDPRAVQDKLLKTISRRQELDLLQQIKNCREEIIKEIERLKKVDALERAKGDAATGPITKKVMEFSEEGITDKVRDIFTRETERLTLDRVMIARTRANKGTLLHQPKLVRARQNVKLPQVFSEGEQTALGLAAFFTEAELDGSKSALIFDDPVSSLDHIRRGLVAKRLTAFAQVRQVVIFTHDIAFVAELKRNANEAGIELTCRAVTRDRSGEKKPGKCTSEHPWKAKDVPSRLNELKRDLANINEENRDEQQYEEKVAIWAGKLSETWERIFSQEIVGPILAEGGLEVRPKQVKIIARFSATDHEEFNASYDRVSQWTKRHDKSPLVNYVPPKVECLKEELQKVEGWFKRIKKYKQ